MTVIAPSGQTRTITAGRRWKDGALHFTGLETAAELTALGCTVLPDPPPPDPPTLDSLRASALARYRSEAASCIAANVPAPWDQLRDLATVEYAAWVDAFRALVAAELSRLEDAVAAAVDAAALVAIVADWPEVV